mmetsp:Transcript_49710/g.139925  ORF Transcript_49710/g.139925 Transcript_49710/m.139925 type:complete len:235 (+) Transcript_49710:194-898(+)
MMSTLAVRICSSIIFVSPRTPFTAMIEEPTFTASAGWAMFQSWSKPSDTEVTLSREFCMGFTCRPTFARPCSGRSSVAVYSPGRGPSNVCCHPCGDNCGGAMGDRCGVLGDTCGAMGDTCGAMGDGRATGDCDIASCICIAAGVEGREAEPVGEGTWACMGDSRAATRLCFASGLLGENRWKPCKPSSSKGRDSKVAKESLSPVAIGDRIESWPDSSPLGVYHPRLGKCGSTGS